MDTITTLAQLQSAIASLPPVTAGKLRVFRGQTKDYSKMQPASYRTPLSSRAIWHIYSRYLIAKNDEQHIDRVRASKEMTIQELWVEALAQHYGSGSSYLDVTHSMESAAWFALHKGTSITEICPFPTEVPPWFSQDTHTLTWVSYARASQPGCIYAFDIDPWDGRDSDHFPPPLTLVDLSDAPAFVQSPRMLAQVGCLVATGNGDGYDLRCHRVAGTPLEVAWPMEGSSFVQKTVEEMFPSPAVDPWFRKFLSMPHVPEVDAGGKLLLSRPLPVTLYRGETEEYNALIKRTQWFLDPPLILDTLQHIQVNASASKDDYLQEVVISGATPLLIEAPLVKGFPSASSGLWNHELLVSDLSETAAVWFNQQKESGEVSLANVLVQLSALEQTWDTGDIAHSLGRITRGLWLAHQGASFVAAEVTQEFPLKRIDVQPAINFRLDAVRRRLVYRVVGTEGAWMDLSTQGEMARTIFVTLFLLRALSPRLKAEASPRRYIFTEPADVRPAQRMFFVPLFRDVARLTRIKPSSHGVADWFVFRNRDNNPFIDTEASRISSCTRVDTEADFIDFPATFFENIIKTNLAALEDSISNLEAV